MSKRPPIDLMALTSDHATSMPESVQRITHPTAAAAPKLKAKARHANVRTENLEALAFKVPPAFRKRFKHRAVNADLQLNELLIEALNAWEEQQGIDK